MGPVSDPGQPEPENVEDAAEEESVEFVDHSDDDPTYRLIDCTDATLDHTEAAEVARRAVQSGECIVLPTDTVYGIGADAFSADAVQGLLHAKERGRDMPPPVLIGEASLIRALATDVPALAQDLVARHWPGALTVICKIQPSLRMDLGDAEGTIALRVPDHALAREVLRQTGPLAVSSANLSGRPAALTIEDAVDQLGESVAVYLDGGPLGGGGGLPSTIVDFTRHGDGQVLRRGAISVETLRETAPDLLDLPTEAEVAEDGPSTISGTIEQGSSPNGSEPAAGG